MSSMVRMGTKWSVWRTESKYAQASQWIVRTSPIRRTKATALRQQRSHNDLIVSGSNGSYLMPGRFARMYQRCCCRQRAQHRVEQRMSAMVRRSAISCNIQQPIYAYIVCWGPSAVICTWECGRHDRPASAVPSTPRSRSWDQGKRGLPCVTTDPSLTTHQGSGRREPFPTECVHNRPCGHSCLTKLFNVETQVQTIVRYLYLHTDFQRKERTCISVLGHDWSIRGRQECRLQMSISTKAGRRVQSCRYQIRRSVKMNKGGISILLTACSDTG